MNTLKAGFSLLIVLCALVVNSGCGQAILPEQCNTPPKHYEAVYGVPDSVSATVDSDGLTRSRTYDYTSKGFIVRFTDDVNPADGRTGCDKVLAVSDRSLFCAVAEISDKAYASPVCPD